MSAIATGLVLAAEVGMVIMRRAQEKAAKNEAFQLSDAEDAISELGDSQTDLHDEVARREREEAESKVAENDPGTE